MKIREHRGGYDESMATVQEIKPPMTPFEHAWALVRKEVTGEVGAASNPWKFTDGMPEGE